MKASFFFLQIFLIYSILFQVHVQTNEDDLEEEIQTDEILTCNKWTQHPPEYLGSTKTGNEIRYVLSKEVKKKLTNLTRTRSQKNFHKSLALLQERLGVGGDLKPEDEEGLYNKEVVIQPKTAGLLTFLSWASQVRNFILVFSVFCSGVFLSHAARLLLCLLDFTKFFLYLSFLFYFYF